MLRTIFLNLVAKPASGAVAFLKGASSAIWTFPAVLGSAIVIAWAAEAAQFLVSQGLALAILAWLQTLPEFAVEAVIAWDAGQTARSSTDPVQVAHATALMTANFTGSLRLLVGLGWPMIYCTAAFFRRKQGARLNEVKLDEEHAVEVVFLIISIAYFFIVWYRGTLSLFDTVMLTLVYFVYLFFLNKIPPQGEEKIEDIDRIPRFILQQKKLVRNALISGLFLAGGGLLYVAAHPFLESLKAIAVGLGLSTFVFVQWVAPFLSEFPEKVSAFNWARRITTAPMALMNMVSSNINQWTMLVAMLPIVYAISVGEVRTIHFDEHQRLEILLTLGQSLLGAFLLANMRFSWWEAAVLFVLWAVQFLLSGFEKPLSLDQSSSTLTTWAAGWLPVGIHQIERFAAVTKYVITMLYFAWAGILVVAFVLKRQGFEALTGFRELMRRHW
jgi:cation:H+ antiporter